jgi:hypothetical protein
LENISNVKKIQRLYTRDNGKVVIVNVLPEEYRNGVARIILYHVREIINPIRNSHQSLKDYIK